MTKGSSINRRVVLTAPNSITRTGLSSADFRLVSWPVLQIQPPETATALDEAIHNLYGYDWIILVNADAARFFLGRLAQQGRDVSELDVLRICAVAEATATALEDAQVHVDVVATEVTAPAIVEQLAEYVGGETGLKRLNFLLPQAIVGRDYLKEELEDRDARADVVAAYQTVSNADMTRLAGVKSMLGTGSVDAIVFGDPGEVWELARVLDRNDLGALLRNTTVLTADDATTAAALLAGIPRPQQANEKWPRDMIELVSKHFEV